MSRTLKHYASPSFWKEYEKLPEETKRLADKNFKLLKRDPYHFSLHLKKVANYWPVRIGRKYRAIGIEIEEGIVWFWT